MKSMKLVSFLLAGTLVASSLVGCSQPSHTNTEEQENSASQEQLVQKSTAEQEAEQLLSDLTGSYEELFPVLFDEQYDQEWVDDSATIVGEGDAEATAEMLKGSVGGTIWGEEAVEAYGEEGGPFYCGWLEGLTELTIDGDTMTISGKNATGKELFSSTYHYCDMADSLYVFESDDNEESTFKYFAFLPDTPETTYHIEFRYGSDDSDIGEWMAGEYAYWMASGIPVDYTQETVKNAIKLFCDENLAQE